MNLVISKSVTYLQFAFEKLQKTHNKVFKNPEKEVRRYRNWKVNRTVIEQHNKKIGRNTGQVLYKMKETRLTDYVNIIFHITMTVEFDN